MKRKRRSYDEKGIGADLNCGNNIKYIPVGVIAEILLRLPIKSIGRFTSVSKSWRDIITSPGFYSMNAKSKPLSTFYATSPFYGSRYKGHVVEVSETGKYVTTTTVRPRVRRSKSSSMRVVGSCNGLLCILKRKIWFEVITILNPITNESTRIALKNHDDWIVGSNKGEEYKAANGYHVFGYSPSTNEYKVFKGLSIVRGGEVRNSYAIFTVGVDRKWRKLSPHLFANARKHSKVVLCNGAFHWLVDGEDDPSLHSILSLDIARENTRRMSVPPRINQQFLRRLLVLNNCLCLFVRSYWGPGPDEGQTILWKMEDYGDDDSWSRIVIPPMRIFTRHNVDTFAPLDCATKYGGILFGGRQHGHLRFYCPKQKRQTAIRVVV